MADDVKETGRNSQSDGTSTFMIENRSLAASNKRLAAILKPGMRVLDVGCGTGAITAGIAQAVQPLGFVIGIDHNQSYIEKARETHEDVPDLAFETGDVFNLGLNKLFKVVTAARVLQWLPNPELALQQMIKAAKKNGKILILDYNHRKFELNPSPPPSMQKFLTAYLDWRATKGMDVEIADHLAGMFEANGLEKIVVTPQHETVRRGEPGFETAIKIRAEVVAGWGRVMVGEGVISEEDRAAAEKDYLEWIEHEAESQFMYLLAVEGTRVL